MIFPTSDLYPCCRKKPEEYIYGVLDVTDEGEYVCPVCTVFGLDKEEVKILCGAGLKFTDHNKEAEGYEVKTSAFKASTNAIKS